jgi:FMN reductase
VFRFLNAVAITGNLASPSRGADLGRVMLRALEREHAFQLALLEMAHLARPLGQALHRGEATRELEEALDTVECADVLVLVTPLRRGSLPGLFKHFLDLLNPEALREVPVLLGTTGHHADQQRLIEDAILPIVRALGARPVQISLFASESTPLDALRERARVAAKLAMGELRPSGHVLRGRPATGIN